MDRLSEGADLHWCALTTMPPSLWLAKDLNLAPSLAGAAVAIVGWGRYWVIGGGSELVNKTRGRSLPTICSAGCGP